MWINTILGAFFATLLLHSIFARKGGSISLVWGFLAIAFFVTIMLGSLIFYQSGFSETLFSTLMIYAALCELYIFIFTLSANGVSVAILDKLTQKNATLSFEALDQEYSLEAMVDRRINQLQSGGFITVKGENCYLLPQGMKLVRIFKLLKIVFRHPLHGKRIPST